jgi:hypothetical protein
MQVKLKNASPMLGLRPTAEGLTILLPVFCWVEVFVCRALVVGGTIKDGVRYFRFMLLWERIMCVIIRQQRRRHGICAIQMIVVT